MPPRAEQTQRLSRRAVLRYGLGAAATIAINSACAPKSPAIREPFDPLAGKRNATVAPTAQPTATVEQAVINNTEKTIGMIDSYLIQRLMEHNKNRPEEHVDLTWDVIPMNRISGPLLLVPLERIRVRDFPYAKNDNLGRRIPNRNKQDREGYFMESIAPSPDGKPLDKTFSYFVSVTNDKTGSRDIWAVDWSDPNQFRVFNVRDSSQPDPEINRWSVSFISYENGEQIDPETLFEDYIPQPIPTVRV